MASIVGPRMYGGSFVLPSLISEELDVIVVRKPVPMRVVVDTGADRGVVVCSDLEPIVPPMMSRKYSKAVKRRQRWNHAMDQDGMGLGRVARKPRDKK